MAWKLFEELWKVSSEILLILYVVFVASELHPDTIFFQHFLS